MTIPESAQRCYSDNLINLSMQLITLDKVCWIVEEELSTIFSFTDINNINENVNETTLEELRNNDIESFYLKAKKLREFGNSNSKRTKIELVNGLEKDIFSVRSILSEFTYKGVQININIKDSNTFSNNYVKNAFVNIRRKWGKMYKGFTKPHPSDRYVLYAKEFVSIAMAAAAANELVPRAIVAARRNMLPMFTAVSMLPFDETLSEDKYIHTSDNRAPLPSIRNSSTF
ncbi:MAG: hypothetical protein HON32_06430 [Francisellaceae bacterium]|jgi:hypothetical protein|nr:hypothetical protein [Francisellaceae bacterium]MBT6539547.1 hypothetical protein [Francisellaceae bacterium]